MDFFKSVFSDEPDPPKPEPESPKRDESVRDPISPLKQQQERQNHPNPNPSDSTGGGWSFGGLIKTLTTKSESVIETYSRDLKEFGSGLRKEIDLAQGSLGNVSHAIDELGSSVLKGTAEIISHGKDAILALDHESDYSSDTNNNNERNIGSQQSLNSKRYSRFDAQLLAIQGDAGTYCEEPEDLDDYKRWKLGFDLDGKREERDRLIEENGGVESMYKKVVVPNVVDEETFWFRYYYRVYKLKQAEDLRANIVKRAISADEEDLSWDVDDEEEDEEEMGIKKNVGSKVNLKENDELGRKDCVEIVKGEDLGSKDSIKIEKGEDLGGEVKEMSSKESEQIVNVKAGEEERGDLVEESEREKVPSGGDNVAGEKVDSEQSKEVTVSKSDEGAGSECKGDNGGSSKDSEFSVVSSHQSMQEEEDLGWDEIEDLSSIDEKKVTHGGSPNKVDLRKRLSAAEEEEDLSWDIEDDDEPAKA